MCARGPGRSCTLRLLVIIRNPLKYIVLYILQTKANQQGTSGKKQKDSFAATKNSNGADATPKDRKVSLL